MLPQSDQATVLQTLREYYAASNKRDVPGMVAYFHEPVTFITAGGVNSLATRADAARVLEQFMARLKTLGAIRTDWTESHVKQLSDTLAVAGIALVRVAADGRELERVGWTYLLQKTASGWKIAVLASHPTETVLQLDD
jgi:ketosteroid isomerase-like protein